MVTDYIFCKCKDMIPEYLKKKKGLNLGFLRHSECLCKVTFLVNIN